MTLTSGSRIGPYEIVGLLGAGGMGEVYRARDAALNREVALKVLSEAVVADADRLARFSREAQALAALNHPNIGQIYGLEGHALVLELVEGPTLEEIIFSGDRGAAGPRLQVDEALRIARQIALALEAAHERGIIHRDLKPSNIKVREDGTVKVLDFGLAKAMTGADDAASSVSNSPTLTARATQLGMILGTAAYMSPEQARGKTVDRRADVWAFGVVLYEMLTGRRAFDGSEVSDVLASVLKDTVAVDAVPAATPAPIRRLLRRCLVKDRADRLDSMASARLEIADALESRHDEPGLKPAEAAGQKARPRFGVALTIAVVALAVGLAAGWVLFRSPSVADQRVVRFSIPLPADKPLTGVAIIGAGDTILYEADRLYVRSLSDAEPRPLAGTEGGRNLFLSPDSKWAGFFQNDQIKKVAIGGGDALTVADVPGDSPGAAWAPNNTVIFSPGWNAPLSSVSADGEGKPAPLSTLNTAAGELGHWWPEPLPDGKTVLFTVWMAASGINDARIAALDLTTRTHRVIMPGSAAKYIATGHLLYFHAGAYHVVPFDPVALRATGDPVKVLPDAKPYDPNGTRLKPLAVSPNGTLVYVAGALTTEADLRWVTPAGVMQPINLAPLRYSSRDLSPDGRQLATSRLQNGTFGLWLTDLQRLTDVKVDAPGTNWGPAWSPTGDFLVFTSMRGGHFDASMIRPGETPTLLIADLFDQTPHAVTRDGRRFLLTEYYSDGSAALAVASLEQPKERKRLVINAGNLNHVTLSPDDRWIAASTSVSGRSEISVHPFDRPGPSVRVTSRGGASHAWSRTAPVIYYARDDELVAATYSTAGDRFAIVREQTIARPGTLDLAGLAPDGRLLIALERPGQAMQLRVVVNWTAEIR